MEPLRISAIIVTALIIFFTWQSLRLPKHRKFLHCKNCHHKTKANLQKIALCECLPELAAHEVHCLHLLDQKKTYLKKSEETNAWVVYCPMLKDGIEVDLLDSEVEELSILGLLASINRYNHFILTNKGKKALI